MNDDLSLRRKEENEDARLIREGAAGEEFSSEDPATRLADGIVTRAQALKLAGLGGAGFMFTLLWPKEADARRKKRRKRRRKARVSTDTPGSTPGSVQVTPNAPVTLNVTNPGANPLTIERVQVLDSDGDVIHVEVLDDPVTIDPGQTEVVELTIEEPLVVANADRLRLIDERGVPITVVDDGSGVTVGDIKVDPIIDLP